MPLFCPGCSSELDPSATSCGVCLRGRSRQEIFRGMRELQEQAKTARRKPFLIAGGVLALAAAGFGAFKYQQLRPKPAPPAAPAQAAAVPETPPPAPAAAVAPPTIAAAPAIPAPAEPAANPYSTALPEKYKRGKQTASGRTETAEDDGRWVVKGKAYELMSLKPVAGANLTFTDKNDSKAFRSVTKADGTFQVRLPRVEEGGFEVTVSHKDYLRGYLDEMEPPFEGQSRARREEARQMANQAPVLHVPILPPEKGDVLDYNLVLLAK